MFANAAQAHRLLSNRSRIRPTGYKFAKDSAKIHFSYCGNSVRLNGRLRLAIDCAIDLLASARLVKAGRVTAKNNTIAIRCLVNESNEDSLIL
jgi:hypothetical protein